MSEININEKIKERIKQKRKEKNIINCKAYYKEHREEMIKKGCEKVICENCGRTVIKNNIKKHKNYLICQRNGELKREIEEELKTEGLTMEQLLTKKLCEFIQLL